MNKFIDISSHNHITSFPDLAKSRIQGVIIKATEGTSYTNERLKEQYEGCSSNNIKKGFYHFLTSYTTPEDQANHFWNTIKNKRMEILPVLDIETEGLKKYAENLVERFITEFRLISGIDEVIIYSGRCYIEETFTINFIKNNKWWVADYSASSCPNLYNADVVAWQYTDKYKAFNFVEVVDCNYIINPDSFFFDDYGIGEYAEIEIRQGVYSELQKELNRQGFKDKNGNELVVDGIPGKLTLSACPMLKRGAQGGITKWIQERLQIEADGIFGVITEIATKYFQLNNNMFNDGIIGKGTWKKFLKL